MKFFFIFSVFSKDFRILSLYHWGFAFSWRYTRLYQKDMTIRPGVLRNVTRTLLGLKWTDRGFGENSGISPLDIEMGTKTPNPKWTEKLDIIRYWSFFAPTTDLVANFLTLRTPELTWPICVKLVKIGLNWDSQGFIQISSTWLDRLKPVTLTHYQQKFLFFKSFKNISYYINTAFPVLYHTLKIMDVSTRKYNHFRCQKTFLIINFQLV